MYVLPVITPPGMKAGIEATVKITPTVLNKKNEETQMEVNEPPSSSSSSRPPVQPPHAAQPKDYISPGQADKAGIRLWAHEMLCVHPFGSATVFEQCGNSYVLKLKAVLDTMTQSLRINEDGYTTMFAERLKATKDAKTTLAQAKALHEQAVAANAKQSDLVAELAKAKEATVKYKDENEFLKFSGTN